MAQHGPAVLGVRCDGLERVALGDGVGQVLELARDPRDDDGPVREQLGRGGAVGDRPLLEAAVGLADGDLGHVDSNCSAGRP